MNVNTSADETVARLAASIGEPARARILYCLMDNHARTSTELAVVAQVSPSTASVHLNRLTGDQLVKVKVQGRHRYYCLGGTNVAAVLERLSVLAGGSRDKFIPSTPSRLRAARTCYDHTAGALGVLLHGRFRVLRWLMPVPKSHDDSYSLSKEGVTFLEGLGVDVERAQTMRRRFAFGCLDWSERQFHIGGALGAALLDLALRRKWVNQDLDSRALGVTTLGRREMLNLFGANV